MVVENSYSPKCSLSDIFLPLSNIKRLFKKIYYGFKS